MTITIQKTQTKTRDVIGLPPTSGSRFVRVRWDEAERLAGRRLDRRKAYYCREDRQPEGDDSFFPGVSLFVYGEWSDACSGCTESEMGHYTMGSAERGVGCDWCGYTGRKRDGMFFPVDIPENSYIL